MKVARVSIPGLYEDGEGLRLVVTNKGVKRWTLRLTIAGRRVERGLGMWPDVSLEDARVKASEFRSAAKNGRDLRMEAKKQIATSQVTFRNAFDAFFDVRRQQLSNRKHIQQWQNTMPDYVFPSIGDRPVGEITASEILSILEPIWFHKPETASRILQRINATFDSAILRGARERANPCIGIARELGPQRAITKHHPALPWRDVPAFVTSLGDRSSHYATKLALKFLIHTVTRSAETRLAQWSESDLDSCIWTIPPMRMKMRQPHIVPLTGDVMEILSVAQGFRVSNYVFPGQRGQPLSDNTLSKLMRGSKTPGTPHGFRSSFKDWAAEQGIRDEVSEAVLAHVDTNRSRAAYRRTNYLEERTCIMRRWSHFLVSPTAM